jgi:hypothetical protein
MIGKRSFLLYADLIHTANKLTDEKAGQLLKHILMYVNDQDPETDDPLLEIAFEPIKQQLKRDLERWTGIKELRSKAGKASAAKRAQQKQQKSTHAESDQQSSTHPTVNENVNENVNVNVKKDYSLILDFWNDKDFQNAWSDWISIRTKKKASRSDLAITRALNKLKSLSCSKMDSAIKILNQSADGGWCDLYELKDKSNEQTNKLNYAIGTNKNPRQGA